MLDMKKQSGIALLLYVVFILGITSVIAGKYMSDKVDSVAQKKALYDEKVLKKAKQALLSYAVSFSVAGDASEMGRLPCPDYFFGANPEGTQDANCGQRQANAVGYFPWKTLGIDVLKDSASECLWYVVSGDYKDLPEAEMLNEDSNGLLWVQDENGLPYHGLNPGDRPIALIIAPQESLPGQNRIIDNVLMEHCLGGYDEDDYLESAGIVDYTVNHEDDGGGDDDDNIWTYVYGSIASRIENTNYNDRMVWITRDEYWNAVRAQNSLDATDVTSEINQLTSLLASCLVDYANDGNNENRWLPWPAAIDMADYRNDKDSPGLNEYINQNAPALLTGRLPQNIVISNAAENVSTGTNITLYPDMTDIFQTCLTVNQKALWRNWKDHFFYVVSKHFEVDGSTLPITNRCVLPGDCITVDGSVDRIAAVIFYSDSVNTGQSRNSEPVDADEKNILSNYLESPDPDKSNAHFYPVDAAYTGAGGDVNEYYHDIGDLAYCIIVGPTTDLNVTDCT